MSDPALVWETNLRKAGHGEEAIAQALAGLERFCAEQGVTPAEVLVRWTDWPELAVRRTPRSTATPNLLIESFLIHNGINVFGDLICVPRSEEGLQQQYGPDRSRWPAELHDLSSDCGAPS